MHELTNVVMQASAGKLTLEKQQKGIKDVTFDTSITYQLREEMGCHSWGILTICRMFLAMRETATIQSNNRGKFEMAADTMT